MSDTPVRMRTVTPLGELPEPTPQTISQMSEDKIMAFVSAEIEKMQAYTNLGSGRDPQFYEVNAALAAYQSVQLGLLTAHNLAKLEHTKAKEVFDDWFAAKYIDTRNKANPQALSAQKWSGAKEIEMMVRVEYSKEYRALSEDVLVADHQLNFLRRLLDSWDRYAFVLNNLSKNLIAEVRGLGVSTDLLNDNSDGH